MKTPPNTLEEAFEGLLIQTLASEKKYVKLFAQFSGLAFTDQLSAALSPSRNELEQHVERLSRVLKHLNLRPSREGASVDDALLDLGKEICGYKKQRSVYKDIQILGAAKLITYHQISVYSTLEAMAKQLGIETYTTLLEQTCTETRNAASYFYQIEQNILYPGIVKSEHQF